MSVRACIALFMFCVVVRAADVLPTDRPAAWRRESTGGLSNAILVGVPGGIPSGSWEVVDVTTLGVIAGDIDADPSTLTDCTATVNTWLTTNANTNRVLYFPAGSYRVTAINAQRRTAIRGAGMFRTLIQMKDKQ